MVFDLSEVSGQVSTFGVQKLHPYTPKKRGHPRTYWGMGVTWSPGVKETGGVVGKTKQPPQNTQNKIRVEGRWKRGGAFLNDTEMQ